MSDDDDMVAHESGDAGASNWYPGEAGQVKKSGHILMKGDKPCKVRQDPVHGGGGTSSLAARRGAGRSARGQRAAAVAAVSGRTREWPCACCRHWWRGEGSGESERAGVGRARCSAVAVQSDSPGDADGVVC